jgi:hypothetical protein
MSKSLWSDQEVQLLIESYSGDNSQLAEIARSMKKTIPMIRSKLVALKKYQKPEVVAKVGGASSLRKITIVKSIAKTFEQSEDTFASFEKASKTDLELLLKLANSGFKNQSIAEESDDPKKSAIITTIETLVGAKMPSLSRASKVDLELLNSLI